MTFSPSAAPEHASLQPQALILAAGRFVEGKPEPVFPEEDILRPEFLLGHAHYGQLPAFDDDPLPADTLRDDRLKVSDRILARILEGAGGTDGRSAIPITEALRSCYGFLARMQNPLIAPARTRDALGRLAQRLIAILAEGRQCGATHLIYHTVPDAAPW